MQSLKRNKIEVMNRDFYLYKQRLSLLYLWVVPIVTAVIGFGIGHVSYKLYLPLWGLNSCLMILASYHLGAQKLWYGNKDGRQCAVTALLLCTPWLLFPVFAGMGPPPVTIAGWLNTAAEQQTRYTILIGGGVSALSGTALLKVQLQARGETFYSALAFAALSIAIPLFIFNMAFWGYYLTAAFRSFASHAASERPDWYLPVKSLFYVISVVEVILIYLGAILFAASLKITGVISKTAFRWYLVCGLFAILLVLVPSSWPQPLATAGYIVSIPAIPFVMYYLIGLRLLKSA